MINSKTYWNLLKIIKILRGETMKEKNKNVGGSVREEICECVEEKICLTCGEPYDLKNDECDCNCHPTIKKKKLSPTDELVNVISKWIKRK